MKIFKAHELNYNNQEILNCFLKSKKFFKAHELNYNNQEILHYYLNIIK